MNNLILLRGLPGAGKSTAAGLLGSPGAGSAHYEADMYFALETGEYQFDATKLPQAHSWCKNMVEKAMIDDLATVIVSNTFTQEWEMKDYYALAEKYGYRVTSLIVENRHGGVNIHDVPEEALDKMEKRFVVKLR
jgi:predicted kinase